MEAIVVGAGVVGLTTAVRLREAGWDARVWTAHDPLRTVSAVAAAIWYPYRAEPPERVNRWARETYDAFTVLARDHPESGVRVANGVEYWREAVPPMWDDAELGSIARELLPPRRKGFAAGHRFAAPIAEMPVYLPWLARRLEALGGVIETRRIASLAEAEAPLVVNCTGLGAFQLVPDPAMHPIRGQVVWVENPGLTEWIAAVDEHTATYVIPRSRDCVLGGTAQVGDWNLETDAATARSIVERCIDLEPRLAGARILEHRVGLRPGRDSEVRLEMDSAGARPIIHNYGHGGAGMTLSWGCADEVVRLAASLR